MTSPDDAGRAEDAVSGEQDSTPPPLGGVDAPTSDLSVIDGYIDDDDGDTDTSEYLDVRDVDPDIASLAVADVDWDEDDPWDGALTLTSTGLDQIVQLALPLKPDSVEALIEMLMEVRDGQYAAMGMTPPMAASAFVEDSDPDEDDGGPVRRSWGARLGDPANVSGVLRARVKPDQWPIIVAVLLAASLIIMFFTKVG